MRNREWSKVVGVTGRILLALLFVFSQSAWAGQDPRAKDNPKPAQNAAVQQTGEKPSPAATTARTETEEGQAESPEQSSADEKPSGDGKHEGIKVHGHWTIEVRNPDGTLVSHREFENAYYPSSLLASLLARQASVGFWDVGLNGSVSAPGPCVTVACEIFETGYPLVTPIAPGLAQGLMVTANTNTNTLTLAGSIAAPSTGLISIVFTALTACPNSIPAATPCTTGLPSPQPFTSITLTAGTSTPPISVSQGQVVSVTVVISFS